MKDERQSGLSKEVVQFASVEALKESKGRRSWESQTECTPSCSNVGQPSGCPHVPAAAHSDALTAKQTRWDEALLPLSCAGCGRAPLQAVGTMGMNLTGLALHFWV